MTSKERLLQSLSHQQPDRIPVDFGSSPVTGIHVKPVEELRDYFGLEKKPVKVIEPYQMLGEVDDDLLDALGVDVIGLEPRKNLFGLAQDGWKEYQTIWQQEVLVPGEFNVTNTDDGGIVIYPEGDTTAKASGKMPETGYFFDAIIRQEPIDDNFLNVEDNLEEFSILNENDIAYWKKRVQGVEDSERGILANFGGTAFGDIALVPAPNLRQPKGIRDIAEWYMSLVTRPEYVHSIFERQSEIAIRNLETLHQHVGDKIDVLFVCGTDFGTQDSTFCSTETFDEMWGPYYRKINTWVHANTSWKTFKHCCGAIEPFIRNFINVGFDILNPVQINAAGMDPKHLKDTYGDEIVFWGGGVDTQKMLPFGTPQEVERHVMDVCEIFSKNGGFVFNTVHNVQANVPIENIIAMLEGIKKYNTEGK